MDNAQLINQTTGRVEWYTPAPIVEAARRVLGGIDLDPASCAKANETVQAERYYTIADDGLSKPWYGRIWLNHPFGRTTNKDWIDKAVGSYERETAGIIDGIACITFAATSEAWFQPLFAYPICFLAPRVNYLGPDGRPVRGVTKGSCVTYLGPSVDRFVAEFGSMGRVMIPAGRQ